MPLDPNHCTPDGAPDGQKVLHPTNSEAEMALVNVSDVVGRAGTGIYIWEVTPRV